MFKTKIFCLLTLISLAAPLAPQASAAVKKVDSVEGITEYRLDNGLQVLLYPDVSKPNVTVNLTVMVGSRHEGYGETGMAHLLEHMLFKGTPTFAAIPKELQQRGARFNGTTWVDRTNYYETLPATDENLDFALRLEADRMLNSYVKHEDLISEMTVVRNEFERGENSPQVLLNQRLMSVAFDWHNYGKSTIGNRTDIERVPIDRLQAFYKKYYQPDNAMLVLAGKFDPAKALALIEKYFGSLPKPKRKLDKTYTEEPAQDGERLVTLRRVGEVALVGAVYHTPAGPHPDAAALEVLEGVLDMAPAGRLYKALVESHKATSVDADFSSFHDAGVFEVDAEVRRDDSLDSARDSLLEVVENLGSQELTTEEVERSKLRILKQREMSAADTGKIAVDLSNWASQGDWRLYFLHRDRIEKVTPKDVQNVAAKYLRANNRTLGVFIPTDKPELAKVPETPDLAKTLAGYKGRAEIAVGEAFEVTPENIEKHVERTTVGEGVKAVLLPKKNRGETVRVHLTLRYGSPESLKGFETAADFLPVLMTRGTKQLTRQQIQDQLDKNSATLAASGDTGVATFAIETKKANLPAVLELARQILREPSLPADEFEILQRQQLSDLEEQLTDPQQLALSEVRRTVSPYDKSDVRYIPTVNEDLARTKALKLTEIKKLYETYLSAQAGEVAVVGDFDVDQTKKALAGIFKDWTAKQAFARIPKQIFPKVKGSTKEIPTPDKANAVYIAGLAFPVQDTNPDYPALLMGNYVFGGGALSSRLGDRVRQKEGLSYGVGSMFGADPLDPRASVTVFAITNPANIKKVDVAVREELDKLLKSGVTADELAKAKTGYLQQQQVARTNDAALASTLSDTAYLGRTMAFYSDLEKKIEATTAEQVLAALGKYVDGKRLSIVMAGDFEAAQKQKETPETKKPASEK